MYEEVVTGFEGGAVTNGTHHLTKVLEKASMPWFGPSGTLGDNVQGLIWALNQNQICWHFDFRLSLQNSKKYILLCINYQAVEFLSCPLTDMHNHQKGFVVHSSLLNLSSSCCFSDCPVLA